MLRSLFVREFFKPEKATVNIEDPVWKAWRVIKDKELKTVPVTKGQKIVGLVSDRDIVQISGYNGGQSMPVKEAMSLNPLVVNEGSTLAEVMQSMLNKDQQVAVVVDSVGRVAGLFSWTCALKFLLGFMEKNKLLKKGLF